MKPVAFAFVLLACTCVSAQETPAIAGVVRAGTPVQLVKEGFEAVEGPLHDGDALLFTNNRLGRVLRIGADGSVSTWYEAPGGANALTRTTKGEIIATMTEAKVIAALHPGEPPRVVIGEFEGLPFNRPNDLVADRRGNLYFSDTVGLNAAAPPPLPSSVYQLKKDGRLVRVTSAIGRPNGVALSPDERTLYVADTTGEWVHAFALDRKGDVKSHREFARLALPSPPPQGGLGGAGTDGLAVDEDGRLYVATTVGVQVFSTKGEALGVIAMPKQPQNLAFAGPAREFLYVVGRGAVYRIATLTHGPKRPGK